MDLNGLLVAVTIVTITSLICLTVLLRPLVVHYAKHHAEDPWKPRDYPEGRRR